MPKFEDLRTVSINEARKELPAIAEAFYNDAGVLMPIVVTDRGTPLAVIAPTWVAAQLMMATQVTLDAGGFADMSEIRELMNWFADRPVEMISDARRDLSSYVRTADVRDKETWKLFGPHGRRSAWVVPLSPVIDNCVDFEEWGYDNAQNAAEDEWEDLGQRRLTLASERRYSRLRQAISEYGSRFDKLIEKHPIDWSEIDKSLHEGVATLLGALESLEQQRQKLEVTTGIALLGLCGKDPSHFSEIADSLGHSESRLLDLIELGLADLEA